jgi:hypothetical protein
VPILNPKRHKQSSRTKTLTRRQERLFSRLKLGGNQWLRIAYENVTLELQASRKSDRMTEETAILRTGKSKQFFNFVKSKTKEIPPIPTLRLPDSDAEYQTAAAKSEAFSDFFASVFSTDNGSSLNFGSRTQNELNRVVFTEQNVLNSIKNCNSSFAAGPDGFHSFFSNTDWSPDSGPLSPHI